MASGGLTWTIDILYYCMDRRRSGGPFRRVVGCICSVEWYCVRALASAEQVVCDKGELSGLW